MSKQKNSRASMDASTAILAQSDSPDKPYYTLDSFYAILLAKKFKSNTEAISFCRDLCSNHGFTVKQEQSTHKSIYVYCSREGLPDSHRNPKTQPQRNRQSQRCECRWRIVLNENEIKQWEFRKSQNAYAFIHNHALLKPEEIKKDWPKQVSENIFELVRNRLPTNEIRQTIRDKYPDITWDDRRFYNRLSEERQKMKQRDTAMRAIRLINICSQICMVNAGSEDLAHYAETRLLSILEETCKFADINNDSIAVPIPTPFSNDSTILNSTLTQVAHPVSHEDIDNCLKKATLSLKADYVKQENDISVNTDKMDDDLSLENKKSTSQKKSIDNLPKGYLAVPVPEYMIQVKMYSQASVGDIRRAIYDLQRSNTTSNQLRRRRSRVGEENDISMDLIPPARKLSRQATLMDDEMDDISAQSSPSNSHSVMFTSTTTTANTSTSSKNREVINEQLLSQQHQKQQQQLISGQYNQYTSMPSSSSSEPMFYNTNTTTNNNNNNSNNNPATNNLVTQSPVSFHPPIYPSIPNTKTSSPQRHEQQQLMYDPNTFVNHRPQADLGLLSSSSSSAGRPHSITFGATGPVLRTNSISGSRITGPPPQQQQNMMNSINYNQLQVSNNEPKQRYYGYQPTSPITPRTPNMSSNLLQQYISPSQEQQEMFNPSYQQPNMFSPCISNNNQILDSQRRNPPPPPPPSQGFNIDYRPEQQSFYRRASGPN